MKRRWFIQAISLLVAISPVAVVFCQEQVPKEQVSNVKSMDASRMQELRNMAVPAWRRIEEQLTSIDVTFRHTLRETKDGTEVTSETTHNRIAWDAKQGLALRRSYNKPGFPDGAYHCITNSGHSFEVWAEDSSRRGILREVTTSEAEHKFEWIDGLPSEDSNKLLRKYGRFVTAAYRFLMVRMETLVDDQRFEPLAVVDEQVKGKRCIRYTARYMGKKANSLREGGIYFVVLDTTHEYRLVNGGISFPKPNPRRETIEVSYDDTNGSFVPKSYLWRSEGAAPGVVTQELVEFDAPKKFDIPEDEFHLKHYGFSDAVLEPLKPAQGLLWVKIAVGIGSLVIGYLLISRRTSSAKK